MNDLQTSLDTYFRLRRGLGFKLRDEGTTLPQFLHFLQANDASVITTELALSWATQPQNASPAHWARRLGMARVFARFHSAVEPRTEVPPPGLLLGRYHRKPPYIYNDDEISDLLKAAGGLQSKEGLRALTYSTLFGLIAITGMRISEPLALNREDVDLAQGVLTVRWSKFRKSRLVPIHSSSIAKLEAYSRRRDEVLPNLSSSSFFVSERGTRLTHWTARRTFVKLSHEIGLRGPTETHGPRLHDLRHTFAVKTLLRWYQTEVDIECHMPELATYLGHTHVNGTYWYISAVPELLQLAAMRMNTVPGGLLS